MTPPRPTTEEARPLFLVRMCGQPVAGSLHYPCTEPLGHGPLPNTVEHSHNGAYHPVAALPPEQGLPPEGRIVGDRFVSDESFDAAIPDRPTTEEARPRLLDLFCGAGLAADGYVESGWDVIGVDIHPQPHYPFEFWQRDAVETTRTIDWFGPPLFDAIHASPPCQLFTRARHLRDAQGHQSKEAVDLLTPTLALLRPLAIPWVVENVEAARSLMGPRDGEYLVRVCGSYFGLEVQRHRLFLSNVPIEGTTCHHDTFPLDPDSGKPRPWGVYHVPGDSIPKGGRTALSAEHATALFGLKRWLPWGSIKEGFPPVYTEWIGAQLLNAAEMRNAA